MKMKNTLILILIALTVLAAAVTVMAETPSPVAMNNKTLGGGQLNVYTPGVDGGTGLNNIGLLVRTCGVVTYYDDDNKFFYIDDGSGLKDGSKKLDGTTDVVGIRVSYKDLAPNVSFSRPIQGAWVTITGISSTSEITVDIEGISETTTKIVRTLLPRKQTDVQESITSGLP
ncbi:MAG: hypothetical protein ABFD46_10175 [Armatimonadota bacterium]